MRKDDNISRKLFHKEVITMALEINNVYNTYGVTKYNDLAYKNEKSPVQIKKSSTDRFEYSGPDELEEMQKDPAQPDEIQEEQIGQEKAEEEQTGQEEAKGDQTGSSGKVGINAGKLARMLAAAKTRAQVQAVIAKIQADLNECEAGEKNGMDVDEASVKAAQQLLQQANSQMSSAENREATPEEEMAAALASLM